MILIDADELKTAFPCGEYVRTESVRATIDHMPSAEPKTKLIAEVKMSKEDIQNAIDGEAPEFEKIPSASPSYSEIPNNWIPYSDCEKRCSKWEKH